MKGRKRRVTKLGSWDAIRRMREAIRRVAGRSFSLTVYVIVEKWIDRSR